MSDSAQPGRRAVLLKYKIHWHVVFTHFPLSFFLLSSGFMVAHEITRSSCFELASYLSLLAGIGALVPSALSGWLTWKSRYKGMKVKVFVYKIRTAFAMMALSAVLILARPFVVAHLHTAWHWIYTVGIVFLLIGAGVEGYHGGRLNHR